jgi:hypothetical protein
MLGDVIITEVMADPDRVADNLGEYVEVWSQRDVDLNGVTLANEGTGMSTVTSATCVQLASGSYGLFVRSEDASQNGGLPPALATFSFSLANSGTRNVSLKVGSTVLDTLAYTSGPAVPAGASLQLKPGLTSPADNDDPSNLCPTPTKRYGGLPDAGDKGTPGVGNEPCPGTPDGG